MATVGDRVHVASRKLGQPPREGVVTGVSGTLLRVRWSTGEESTIVPGTGSVSVVGKAKVGSRNAKSPARAVSTASRPVRKAPAKSAPAKVAKATGAPASKATKAPAKKVTKAPATKVTKAPAKKVTKAPAKKVTKAPAIKVTKAPAIKVTKAPAKKVIKAAKKSAPAKRTAR